MNIPAVLSESAKCLGTIKSNFRPAPLTGEDIHRALVKPVWPDNSRRTVFDIIGPGESTCFIVSDHTRKTAVNLVLPVVLQGLIEKDCSLADMFILIASGIHRHPTPDEIVGILGPQIAREFETRIFLHDPDDEANLVCVGKTKRSHNVRVNRRVAEAKRLVLVGSVTYHYHAGFGGGRKSLVPGVAARDTIAYNHSLTLDPDQNRIHPMADIGKLDGNPVAEEMLEGAYLCRPDIIINTVLTPAGDLVGVFSGELDTAHRAACRLVEQVCRVDIQETADFVLASAETAPNWIQSHKALYNAYRAIRKGGRVILIAPCPEGLGNERFRYWIKKESLSTIYAELRQSVEVLGQTALSTRMRGAETILVTRMSQTDIDDLGIETAPDLETAVEKVLSELRTDKSAFGIQHSAITYYLMPQAMYTVPFLAKKSEGK